MSLNRRNLLLGTITMTMGVVASNCTSSNQKTMPNYQNTGVKLLPGTPAEDGFYFPPEWEQHEFTIMVFPSRQNWQGYGIKAARRDWVNVANTINEFEPVLMVTDPEDSKIARRMLRGDIEIVEFPINDAWARDTAPLFLVNRQGERRVAGFTFNGWGAKFPPYEDDTLLKARLCEFLDTPMYAHSLVLEGGGVVMDGEGTIITTEECLMHPNRNPGVKKEEIERILKAYLGVEQVIWLGRGIVPDPITDGHVDGICTFAAPGVVLLHTTDDTSDPNHQICLDAKRRLQATTDAKGRKLEIIELPLGDDVAHINFYFTNEGIIVPVANDPSQDDAPLGILREVFPEREVVPVNGNVLAAGGGGVHCITQQVPVVTTSQLL